MKGFLIGLGVLVVLVIATIAWAIGVSNSEKILKLRGEAQQTVCQAFFSNMWEIIKTKAGVADQYKDGFKEIYIPLIEGRYSKGDGTLMKWITESNPQFDPALYKDLMVAIEGQRNGFFLEQTKLIDIDREHKTLCALFPASLIVGSRLPIGGEKGIVILKNLATQNAYETGTDSSPDLFPTKK